jgi:AraC family transcriptional regulator of adaptative response/methylated-DNA-[protein]-cysteine methyltransferase
MEMERPRAVDQDRDWQAVMARDAARDGDFVFAVRTTRIYCRPSCPSRRPLRRNVAFYASPAEAQAHGYRACRRCKPDQAARPDAGAALVRKACAFIDRRSDGPPTLEEIAAHVGLSPFHVQRTFKRVLGLSPRAYADARRLGRLKQKLKRGDDVTGALYESGYGSSSRLYESAAAKLGMTPATYRRGGQGMEIGYTIVPSALGKLLVAATARGVAYVALDDRSGPLEARLREEFPAASIRRDDKNLTRYVRPLTGYLDGHAVDIDLPVDVRATAFQRRVWDALRAIPVGETRTYKEIARKLGDPKAARAVGSACGRNPVSLIVPCHRAIREDGGLGGYAWGLPRKEKLLAAERKRASRRTS